MNMDAAFRLTASVSGTEQVERFNKSLKEGEKAGIGMEAAIGKAGGMLKVLAASAAAAGLTAFVKSAIDLGDEMNALSIKTGVAVETLSQFKGAADLADVPMDALAKNINKLSSAIVKNDENGKLLKQLGINAKEGGEAMLQLADVMSNMNDPAARSALAIQLFGKSGADMLPMLVEGRDSIQKLSATMDGEFAAAADNFNDSLSVAKKNAMNLGIAAAKGLLPALNDVISGFNDLTGGQDIIEGFFQAIGEVVRVMAVGIMAAVTAIEKVWERAKAGYYASKALLSGDRDGASAAWQAGSDASMVAEAKFFDFTNNVMSNSKLGERYGFEQRAKDKSDPKPTNRTKNDNLALKFLNSDTKKAADEAQQQAKKDQEAYQQRMKAMAEYVLKIREMTDTLGMSKAEQDAYHDRQELIKQGFIEGSWEAKYFTEQLQKAREEQAAKQQDWGLGMKAGLDQYAEGAMNLMENVKGATVNAFKGMEDALVSFVMTGKLNFKSLANSIIADMVRIMIQQRITGPLAAAIGGMFGSTAAPVAGARASGGPVLGGQTYLVGEKGPELFTAPSGGTIIPNHALGGGGSNTVVVNINAQTGDTTTSGTGDLAAFGKMVGAMVNQKFMDAMRPGGMLAKGMA